MTDPLEAVRLPATEATLVARFWRGVERGGPDDCWPWKATKEAGRYGQLWIVSRTKKEGTHRIAYRLAYGDIPPGMFVLHSCDNRPCCNPAHLRVGTHRDNMDDAVRRRRMRPGRTPRPGEKNPLSKLTSVQVLQIRALRRDGATQASIAAKFGVARTTVAGICRGETWSHL